MSGHGKIQFLDGEHGHGMEHMKSENAGPNGQIIILDMTFDSYHLSTDCGDVPPGTPKITQELSRNSGKRLAFYGSVALFDQNFHLALRFGKLLFALLGKLCAVFKQLYGLFKWKVAALHLCNDGFQFFERLLKA
jgi:hypothetical protein